MNKNNGFFFFVRTIMFEAKNGVTQVIGDERRERLGGRQDPDSDVGWAAVLGRQALR